MYNLFILAAALIALMAGLVGVTVLWTAAVKLMHPKWSWRRCAKYTTLIS
ncbi:MAG: hypothetical protein IKB62_04150 [Oscillospiraceae bacterium]|nr:hypothetical protein [Oscillospiraceae bacterium]